MNFVNALEKIPGIIAQHEERAAKLKADVIQLETIVAKPWGKEDELKALKSELVTLDRKITTEVVHSNEAESEDNCSQKKIHYSDENTIQAQVRNSDIYKISTKSISTPTNNCQLQRR